jgi:CysZ protein
MLDKFIDGANSYRDAWSFISNNKLWSYMIYPGLISLGVAILLVGGGLWGIESWLHAIELPDWLETVVNWLPAWIETSVILLTEIFLMLFIFKYIVMIVAAPFMGPLSEKVESIITGQPGPKFSVKDMGEDISRALRITLRNLIRELLWVLLIFLVQFIIPGIGSLFATVAIFLVQAYYAGFGNFDPVLERQRFTVQQRVQFMKAHRPLSAGNGSIFLLLSMVPILGWFLGPALGTVAATMDGLEELGKV